MNSQCGSLKAKLVLEDGARFDGYIFGLPRPAAGEVVFTTAMTGYPQALTDPSFRGQILVSTYPLVGNYGVPLQPNGEPFVDQYGIPAHFESERIQVSAFVTAEHCENPSHFAGRYSLAAWLEKNGIPGISGIDTRALTKRLRERGVMRGHIVIEDDGRKTAKNTANSSAQNLDTYTAFPQHNLVADVSCTGVIHYKQQTMLSVPAPRIALVDCGAKANILRCLLSRGAEIIRVPWDYDFSSLDCDGIFLSNGPGDPKACGKTIASLRKLFSSGKPVFGICLGVQLMALAAGADTYKLPYGHRSANQPCIESGTDRCYITSQNHGYAVRAETLPNDWEVWFTNANDGTVEGIRAKNAPWSAVQFHPEGCPGPRDTEFLIDRFLDIVRSS
ncbi:MAG: glutamine-hydrolyzing carbamoyl-phosphate synthase small subunit [Spirochaetaceae bacterium]|jgi:carbamoyl-phosphate synthase small subunit|nr:glutamine-hydrolyzing carbamoyl-phosphate synthase small subunit [Spirochaetaceae bacterium]